MAETVEVFNKTLANIKHLKALSDGFMASAKGPILIWEDAQSRKEVVEKNLKKIEVLGHRTNALIEKYRDPSKPEDEASELEIALEQLGDEEEGTEPNTEVIDLFVDGAEAEEVVIWDEGLPIQDGEETVQEEEVVVYEETVQEEEVAVYEEAVQEEEVVVYEDATAQDEAVVGDAGSEEEDSSE
ncbi:uncharacterized protein TrAtP1_006344 [Trichoderma atroviride]|uniref:uncharacterized protein n=1 Tax=Hypocrea atroviridis TaxID=63577 RepID=UPI00332D509B|nr:hypothetical protein TrAtP1_006344 [Trichoderma atroviride]